MQPFTVPQHPQNTSPLEIFCFETPGGLHLAFLCLCMSPTHFHTASSSSGLLRWCLQKALLKLYLAGHAYFRFLVLMFFLLCPRFVGSLCPNMCLAFLFSLVIHCLTAEVLFQLFLQLDISRHSGMPSLNFCKAMCLRQASLCACVFLMCCFFVFPFTLLIHCVMVEVLQCN